MAIRNREIRYEDAVEYIEHLTNKRVRSYRHCLNMLGYEVLFDDGTACIVREGAMFGDEPIEFIKPQKSFCLSCGEDAHFSSFDWQKRCEVTLKKFAEKVRKVFWYRYTKDKSLVRKP